MNKKSLFLLPFILGMIYSFSLWKTCLRFADIFYFSSLDLSLRVNESITNDVGLGTSTVRLFHNKLTGAGIDIATKLTLFFSPVYLIHLLSFAGFCGFLVGLWYLWSRKDKRLSLLLTLAVVVLPLIEILYKLPLPFFVRLAVITLPLFVISLYGLWKLCTPEKMSRKRLLILISLFVLSVWWIYVLGQEALKFCIQG